MSANACFRQLSGKACPVRRKVLPWRARAKSYSLPL